MNKYLIPILSLFLLTCESPERVWDNPNDSEGTLDPSEWSPTNLVILRLSSNEISLNWEYDRDNIGGFKIDRRINENDWVLEYAAVEIEIRQWTDTDAIASDSIFYEYRLYAYAGSNTSAYNITIYNENAPQPVNVTSVTYTTENMTVVWEKYTDDDFVSYELLTSGSQNGLYTILDTIADVNTNSYLFSEFNPLVENWFKVRVTNEFGLSTIGNGMTNNIEESPPTVINITSVTYDTTQMLINWEQSSDNDFVSYELLQSDSENGTYTSVVVITDQSTTSHTLTEYDPLIENWFKVKVTDFWNLTSTGSGMTNSLDSEPTPVNITSVTYDLESMSITWEEYVPNMGRIQQMNQNTRSTVTNDFVSYELLQSDSENGTYTSVVVITDQSTTSHTLTEYDPLIENWFKVKVTDFWNLTSTGNGMTNDIDSPPTQIDISSVTYDLTEMVITWVQSNDNDFVSYELLYSETQSGEQTSITTITDINTTSYTISDFNTLEERWYWIRVTDYWNLTTTSNGYMVLEIPPTPSVLYPISLDNDGFQISWSQNNDDDFQSYKLYESPSEDMSSQTLVYETEDRTETTYLITIEVLKYYQILVEDSWGFQSTSNIEVGDYYVSLWGDYSVLNTTVVDLGGNNLGGSIPPEIGNLTNLTELYLYNNQITGSIPSEIGNLTNLEVLSLYNNQITGSIPSEIGNLTNLEVLYLSINQLTGEIPSELGNLTNLNTLNLKSNQLTGEIPPEIGNLTNLTSLVLSINQLTGEIPPEIGNLTNLNTLNLKSNQLSGIIPDEICNQGDSSPSLENNQLCPPYPSCIENYVGEQDTSDCP
jgi:Leucine-rich repeat (LRR) protein